MVEEALVSEEGVEEGSDGAAGRGPCPLLCLFFNVFKSNQWSKKNFKRLKFSNTSGVLE